MKKEKWFVILQSSEDKIYYGPIPEPENWQSFRRTFIAAGGFALAGYTTTISKRKGKEIVKNLEGMGYTRWKPKTYT